MEMKLYDPISSLDSTTYDWKCRVRVQSFWKGMNRDTQEFWGINMVLIDDSNCRIHAFANAKYCDDVLKKIKEGAIFIVSNIKVKDYVGDEKYRAVRNKKHVFFTPHTKFERDETRGLEIEKFAFDLFHFDAMEKLADDNRFLIDMVGKVKNIQELIRTSKNDEETTRFKFDLYNGRSTVPVTLFDKFGEDVEKELFKHDTRNVFIIICFAKVGRYEGIPHLSNYPATRVYINPEHYSVAEMKKSSLEIKNLPAPASVQDEMPEPKKPTKISTVKLITTDPAQFDEGTANCEVTVKRINDKSSWYFRKCTGCDLELQREGGKFKCSPPNGCGRIIPYPDKRFRLCTLCSDDTGSISVIFPDSEITKIIDKTVTDLHADCIDEKEEEKFPTILNSIVKQKYTIKLFLSDENVKNGSTVYEAKEIMQVHEKGDNFQPNVATVDVIDDLSMTNVTEGDATLNHTPNTENSTNTKVRPRNVTEAVIFDTKEETPPKPNKIIKVEKVMFNKLTKMATGEFRSLEKLTLGECEAKIKVRVIRIWRGATRAGVEFKNFNILLLDNKGKRVHAFIPTRCADEMQEHITLGKVHIIKKFTVQLYSTTDKYRVLRNVSQLVFSNETKIQQVPDDNVSIGHDGFDFYDHSQLEELSKQTTYLTDLVGIIKHHQKLRDLNNKHGQSQRQAKIVITDGRSNVNVTFWDKFGEIFEQAMAKATEQPVIIILSACKVGKWNGEVDVSHVPATQVYLNYHHHSVLQLRKMLKNPEFAKLALEKETKRPLEQLTVDKIIKLGKEYIEASVFTHVQIVGIEQTTKWFYNACTDCGKETKTGNPCPICESCNRLVPYPDKKYRIHVFAKDSTGDMQLILGDREVRTIVGMRARELVTQVSDVLQFPKQLAEMVNKDYSIIIKIRQMNVEKDFKVYWVSNICRGFVAIPRPSSEDSANIGGQTSQTTTNVSSSGIPAINLSSN